MSASTKQPDVSVPGRLEEVADGVFAYIQSDGSWMINNTGFLVASDGVTAVDACSTERRPRAFLDTVAGVTRRPVRTLVNTHHHPDHTGGNGLFTGATIVAHDNARDEMRAMGVPHNTGLWTDVEYGDLRLALPFLTFADRLTLWSDEVRCELLYAGRAAHTTNDIVVWIPGRAVLFAGDLLFNGGTPFLLSGSVLGAIDVLERFVKPLGARTIVPGHGPVTGPEVIDEVLGYLYFVKDVASRSRAAGLTPLEAARNTDLGRYAEWTDTERIVGKLHRAYADLSGTAGLSVTAGQRGGPVNALGALADMVTYNGGRPLTCLA